MLPHHVILLPIFPFLLVDNFFFFSLIHVLLSFFPDQSQFVEGPLERGLQRSVPSWATNAVELRNAHEICSILPATYQISKGCCFCLSPSISSFWLSKDSDCRTNNRIIRKGVFASTVEKLLGSRLMQQDSVTRTVHPAISGSSGDSSCQSSLETSTEKKTERGPDARLSSRDWLP